ncbi:MAG: hypothetical protein GWN58_36645, partial [Anaerolineae bacterium]|nr:hypothetical protein [Anaerolineae bacterium]
MSTTKRRFNRKAGVAIGAAALLVIVVIAALLLRGQGLGLWRVAHLAQAVIDHQAVVGQNHGEFTNV